MNNLVIAFSGGKTSAFMTKWVLDNKSKDYDNIVVLFANTGQEYEETLEFVNMCDISFGFNVVWLEAKVDNTPGVGTKHSIVNFNTASRDGKPFEDVIAKYGIPNQSTPICTRELKLNPIKSYLRYLGWRKKDYYTALGIRIDEPDRISSRCAEDRILYPLIEWFPFSKLDVAGWWAQQDFNLKLKEHQGNCKWCWKKSKRKLLTLAKEDPSIFDFPKRMEKKYGFVKSEPNTPRVFYRGRTTTEQLLEESQYPFSPYIDPLYFDEDLDSPNGCSESCEVFPTK